MKDLNENEKIYIKGLIYMLGFQLILDILVLAVFNSGQEYFNVYVIIGGNTLIGYIMRCYLYDNIH